MDIRQLGRHWKRFPGLLLGSLTIATVASGLVVSSQPAIARHDGFASPLKIPRVIKSRHPKIVMKKANVQIFPPPAAPTRMWTYDGTFPGPTIRRPSGTTTKVTFVNRLPKEVGSTTVHHHGSHSAPEHDGQPHHHLIRPGGKRTYVYEFMEDGKPERAAFQWYHDHSMDVTGRNVWMGLAGMFILDDKVDRKLPLPKGKYDVPLMVADRAFTADNQLNYRFHLLGRIGDHILVNGVPTPHFVVADRKYRFRILNASNYREYRFALDNDEPMIQIASESGLLPEPVARDSIVLGPGERAEVIVDFAGHLGTDIVLKNLFPSTAVGGPPLPDVMQFRVRRDVVDHSRIPTGLRPLPDFGQPTVTRTWKLDQIQGAGLITRPDAETIPPFFPVWTINSLPFEPDRVDARPVLGTTERWIFTNTSDGQHRVHIHDVDWKVVARYGGTQIFEQGDPDVEMGETGLRETFLVEPGETVEVISKFTDHLGRYVFHCHILEHEDNAMMGQFEVVPSFP